MLSRKLIFNTGVFSFRNLIRTQKINFACKHNNEHNHIHEHHDHCHHSHGHSHGHTRKCDWAPQAVVRRPAPHFEGKAWWNGEIKKISLSDFQGKWVVLFFYPLDFTFVCPTEIVQFSEMADQFAKLSINKLKIRLSSNWLFN